MVREEFEKKYRQLQKEVEKVREEANPDIKLDMSATAAIREGLKPPTGCPPYLFSPLIKIVIEEIRKACKKQPLNYGFSSTDNAYEPLKLMQAVMAKTNEVCLRYLDNSMLCSLPIPSSFYFQTSICAVRNRRRKMEDRHVAIHDLNTMFSIQEASPSSYYAIFDGHAGHDAAAYSAAHLHQFLAENKYFISNPEQALLDAFCKTDALFLEKCKIENLSGGTTAVVALLRPKERALYIAWVGDSQALLVKQGKVLQCVNPHKPCREDERERIEKAGGSVMLWGTWRVNGQLAVSRAIGDADYKPHVIAIPDVREISLDGEEDFLIIACDGLWDFLSEDAAAQEVYYMIAENPGDIERISTHLVQLARYQGSTDNISVIIVFLREPHQISAEAHRWATSKGPTLATSNMETGLDNANNPFTNSNGSLKNLNVDSDNINIPKAGDGLLLDLTDNFKQNCSDLSQDIFVSEKSNGTKMSSPDIHFDDDFGPETDVDAVDEAFSHLEKDKDLSDCLSKVLKDESNLKSVKNELKAFTEEIVNNNPLSDEFNPFLTNQKNENINEDSKVVDFEGFHGIEGNRGEVPTPSGDTAHDAGGLEVNVGESDSEDEWNYIKGDQAKPEILSSQPETVVETSEQDDTMSQLNPNAAEFVPVSPTRSIPSPACRALLNEEIISESPKRPVRVDIKVPSEVEFESEVKSRPSDFDKNGHDDEIDTSVRESDKIENLLNGKNIDEIPEFHPGSTPSKLPSEEFHFGPNAAPFTPRVLDQSEAFSTKANYGDDTEQTLNTSFNDSELSVQNKEQTDPMSMSFYAEKGESNPFQDDDDLNKVHRLPENIDEFLQEDIDNNKENSKLNKITDSHEYKTHEEQLDNDQATIQTTDLDKMSQDDDTELASPLEVRKELLDVDANEDLCTNDLISKSPKLNLLDDFVAVAKKAEEKPLADDSNVALLPELEPINADKSKSEHEIPLPDPVSNPTALEVESSALNSSPLTCDEENNLFQTHSPLPEKMDLSSDQKVALDVEEVISESPIELDKSSPLPGEHELRRTESPTPEKTNSVETEDLLKDNLMEKEILVQADIHQSQSPTCELRFDTKSPAVDNEQSSLNAALEVVSSTSLAQSDASSPVPDITRDINQLQSHLSGNASHVEREELTMDNLGAYVPEHTNVDQIGASDEGQDCRSPICEQESKSPVDFEGSKSPFCELIEPQTNTQETAFNPKSEVENIHLAVTEQTSSEALAASPVPACEYSAEPELCDLAAQDVDIRESHSPVDLLEHKQEEEITSSVKDDVSSPIEQLSPMKSPEPLVEESIKVFNTAFETTETSETYIQSESKIEAHSQSVMSIGDLSSCPLPVSSSPIETDSRESNLIKLSTTEEASRPSLTNGLDNMTSEFSEQICIKTDQITMEFAESAVLSPSEESKAIDESVPLRPTQSEAEIPVEMQQSSVSEPEPIQPVQTPEPAESNTQILEEVPASALPVMQTTPLEVKKEVKAEGKKSPAPSSAKKPVGKVEPRKSTGVSKVGAVKASPKPAASSPKAGDAPKVPPKTGTMKPATTSIASKTLTKPKATPAAKPTEKKPIARTEVKPTARTTTTAKKPIEAPVSKTTTRPAGSAAKTSPTKTTAPRPTTATSTTASKTFAAPPRPSTAKPRVPLASRTTTTATATAAASKSSSATTNVKTTTTSRTVSMPKTTTAPPKPRTITSAAPKPRVPLTKTVTKSADLEKEKKESANKLTASRTSAGTKTSGVTASKTTTVKKTEIKSSTDRSVTSKTSATSRTINVIKKAGEVKTSSKTKITKIEKPKQNGVAPTNVTEEIKETTCYNAVNESESQNLIKDNSPLDNKLLIETSNALIDVNPAD